LLLRRIPDEPKRATHDAPQMSRRETPYGSVEVLHQGADLTAWRIEKDGEEIDPAMEVCDREDALVVLHGTLRMELAGSPPVDVHVGEVFVIPAGVPFRGYRWPRNGEPCIFAAVAPAGAEFTPH